MYICQIYFCNTVLYSSKLETLVSL
uniref:Uncharacterized protein n=1 Tax=Anguilla anguilla TaxID=7936 RepID=A0A0E9VLI0_ANGAN